MSEYEMGQDMQELKMRIEVLEKKKGRGERSRPLKEEELSDVQRRNLDLLRQRSEEIVSEMNKILKKNGVNLFIAKFPMLSEQEFSGPQLFPQAGGCCCENGVYVEDCDLCGFIIKAPPGPGPIPIPIPIP